MNLYNLVSEISEATLKDLENKQRDIVLLFPEFYSRVEAVRLSGGIRMVGKDEKGWDFIVHSAKEDKWYPVRIDFGGVREVIAHHAKNKSLWTKDKSRVNTRSLAGEVMYNVDIKVKCGCFTGDTKVKLLDGRDLTMEDIYKEYGLNKEFWVFSCLPDGTFVPQKAVSKGIVHSVNRLMEITLDNGEKVKCTPDHLFLLRCGDYKRADELVENDSLMPLYMLDKTPDSRYSQSYLHVLNNKTHVYEPLHRIVAEDILEREYIEKCNNINEKDFCLVIHHKDFNSHNNSPENLVWMGVYEHWMYHASLGKENAVIGFKKWCKENPEKLLDNVRKGGLASPSKGWKFVDRVANGKKNFEKCGDDPNSKMWGYKDKETREKIKLTRKERGLDAKISIDKKLWWDLHPEKKIEQAERILKINSSEKNIQHLRDLNFKRYGKNHKVSSVRVLEVENIPMYDLTIISEGEPNYALSAGIYVHNCPADLYWGSQYIRSQEPLDANFPPKEERPPVERNPKQHGSMCKHLQVVINLLPMYEGTFAKWLKEFFGADLTKTEQAARREGNELKDRAEEVQTEEEPKTEAERKAKEKTSESIGDDKFNYRIVKIGDEWFIQERWGGPWMDWEDGLGRKSPAYKLRVDAESAAEGLNLDYKVEGESVEESKINIDAILKVKESINKKVVESKGVRKLLFQKEGEKI
jgi:hypothetical protein